MRFPYRCGVIPQTTLNLIENEVANVLRRLLHQSELLGRGIWDCISRLYFKEAFSLSFNTRRSIEIPAEMKIYKRNIIATANAIIVQDKDR